MIPRDFVQQLIARCDIEDIVSSYVSVSRAGRNKKALCPFHSEKTPSFVIYPDTQSFYCFGCGAGGDAISFIMRIENLDYVEAVRLLAKRVGMEVPEDGNDELSKQKAAILQMNREAALFFHKCLKAPIGKAGYEYLKKRQLSDQTIVTYGLGYAPDSWDLLLNHLKQKGFSEAEILASALAVKGRKGYVYDQFRNRVMFPIIDLRGNVIAFGGRVLDDSKPKYLNSPDTPVFKKSRNLFSLNFAKSEIKDRLILAEGYMDVISIYAAGFHNVVATLGTSLTEEQARIMSKYAKEVVISYDSDGPGQTATHRAINLLSDAGVSAKVLHMKDAKDPDEYIKKFGAARFGLLIDGASDVVTHELAAIREHCDLETDEGKISYLKQAVNVLSDIHNSLEREVYAATVARETGIMPDAVIAQTQALLKKKQKNREKREWRDIETDRAVYKDRLNPEKAQNRKAAAAEEGIIAYLLNHPDACPGIREKLKPENIVTEYSKKILHVLYELYDAGRELNLTAFGEYLTPEETQGIAAILAKNHETHITEQMVFDYIDILLSHKDRLTPQQAKECSPEEIESYRKKLQRKK